MGGLDIGRGTADSRGRCGDLGSDKRLGAFDRKAGRLVENLESWVGMQSVEGVRSRGEGVIDGRERLVMKPLNHSQ